jgi:membrane protein DedA with SNARE-associated domain
MLAVFAGRLVRWLILSLLVLKLGPEAVGLMGDVVRHHIVLFLLGLVLVFGLIVWWALRKKGKGREE